MLTPYFNQYKYLTDSIKDQINKETQIPVQLIEEWYESQTQKMWETANPEREKYVRIRNAEPQLLKCFNGNEANFSDVNILNLMIKTGLTFDDIKDCYKSIMVKIKKVYKKYLKIEIDDFDHDSKVLGVEVNI